VLSRVPAPTTDVRGLNVLVVDDNATNRRIVQEMLLNWGMNPMVVESGSAALSTMHEAATAGKPFDLAVIDYLMPEMDGFDLAERIKQNPSLAGTTLIMLTSAGQRGDGSRCADVGISAYLRKPVKQSELFDAIVCTMSPRRETTSQPPVVTRHTLRVSKHQLRILLVEDNPVNRKLAVKMLGKMGHSVSVAGNGLEAVAAVHEQVFDLIFMDVQMPEMDGFEATKAIRETERLTGDHVPIVAMTAHAMQGDREKCLGAGMDGYISKPINSSELFDTIESLMEDKSVQPRRRESIDLATAVQQSDRNLLH
jgi:two-component system, sensor histidine kinase and response regulator